MLRRIAAAAEVRAIMPITVAPQLFFFPHFSTVFFCVHCLGRRHGCRYTAPAGVLAIALTLLHNICTAIELLSPTVLSM